MTARAELERLLSERTGIELDRGGVGRELTRFLDARLRELYLSALSDYLPLLSASRSDELERLLNAVTVVHTWFFRDPGQLAAIESVLAARPPDSECKIWVPGCATGEDVYSIALIAQRLGRRVDVLGTDLNTEALAQARAGRYGEWSVREVDARYWPHLRRSEAHFLVSDAIRERVRFERHNLMDAAPGSARWDLVLCRNVLIYFLRESSRRVFERLVQALSPRGYLLLGASEVVFDVPSELEAVYAAGRLVFRRTERLATLPSAPLEERPPRVRSARGKGPMPAVPRAIAQLSSLEPPAPPLRRATDALLTEGHALLDRGESTAARDVYLRAVEQDGTCAAARLYAGIALYLSGEVERALHELRAASFMDSKQWVAALYLALCYESMGLAEDALREYRHVVRVSETHIVRDALTGSVLEAWQADLLELARERIR